MLPPPEQVRTEHYRPGQRLKVYLLEVHKANRGPAGRRLAHAQEPARRLFELEVPEIFRGIVEIKAIAREPGFRCKVAVYSRQEGIDPVGACVGLRGIRIQNIVNELNGERIDVVQWDPDPAQFVANALSPAQVLSVAVLPDEHDRPRSSCRPAAVAGHRQGGPERPPRRQAHRLAHRHQEPERRTARRAGRRRAHAWQMSAEPDVKRETPIWAKSPRARRKQRARRREASQRRGDDRAGRTPQAAPSARRGASRQRGSSRPRRRRAASPTRSLPPTHAPPRPARPTSRLAEALAAAVAEVRGRRDEDDERRGRAAPRPQAAAAAAAARSTKRLKKSWRPTLDETRTSTSSDRR